MAAEGETRLMRALFAALLLLSLPAQAQQKPMSEAAKAMIGTWEFANADRDRRCTLTFRGDSAGVAGMRLEFDRGCVAVFAFTREITGWTMGENDFLRLLDARGRTVLDFSEVESGVFEAPRPGEGILFIQQAEAPPENKGASQFTGEWRVLRGETLLCPLTLTAMPAGSDFALKAGTPCNAIVTRFGPTTWQVERGEIVLKSARAVWRFEPAEDGTFRRVGAGEPLTLARR